MGETEWRRERRKGRGRIRDERGGGGVVVKSWEGEGRRGKERKGSRVWVFMY